LCGQKPISAVRKHRTRFGARRKRVEVRHFSDARGKKMPSFTINPVFGFHRRPVHRFTPAIDFMAERIDPRLVLPPPAGTPPNDLAAEHALGSAFYRFVFDAHPAPMWVMEAETLRFLAVNNAVVARYGYSREELLNLTVCDVLPPVAAEQLADELAWGGPEPHEPQAWEHRTKAGALLPLEVTISGFEHSGRPAWLVVGTETTDRRRAEVALRESEERLRNVLAHIPCGVFWKDRASIYLGCNDRVARDCGLMVAGEVVGLTDDNLLNPEEAEISRESDRQVIDTGEPLLDAEETRTLASGTKASVLTSRVPLRDASGRVVGVLGVYQDMTERKRLESQLRQSQKMEAIGRLAGGVAHDFNNLLTIISGNVHLIQHLPPGDPEFPQLLDDISDAADRAAALTRQLLTFSRKQPTRPVVLDVNEVVTGLVSMLRRLIGERIVIQTNLAPTPIRIRADRGLVEQVLMNLAVNAKDAMPDGGVLTITTAETTGSGRFAKLAITDTGVGMTDEVKRHLFEPFFTTKDIGKGTGLGLATVYGIVEQAGGGIEVESAPGAGSTFTIRLPWCDAQAKSSVLTGVSNVSIRAVSDRRSVLLVEDEDRVRKLVRFTLEGQGYVVTEAGGGEAALRLLTVDRRIDVLVTDLVMPGIDGRELATRVRVLRPEVGVVFISGYVPDHRRLEGFPGALFLPKPFAPLDLVKTVARALRPGKPTTV
jgi:two-component system cell cycle sensor histidine kinase/response regulator CckA